MGNSDDVRAALGATVAGGGGSLSVADRLCSACVDLLAVDGAAISLMHEGTSRGTFGASSAASRLLDEFQFTFGEGPCLDAVHDGLPISVPDFTDPDERRWPAFSEAALDAGVRAVFALPIMLAAERVGALDLFRRSAGPLTEDRLQGGLLAAKLAALPLLALMKESVGWEGEDESQNDGWTQLASIERVEVYQATGMLMAQLGGGPSEALLRLRAYAFVHGETASEVAWSIVERRLMLTPDDERFRAGPGGGTP